MRSNGMDKKPSERRTTFAELFFDLVFVFAIAEIAALIRHEAALFGYAGAAVLLGLVWWGWSIYTWMGNLVDLTRPVNRAGMIFATALVFLMALVLPEALDESGVLFAVLYAAVRITGLSFYWAGLRRDPEGRAALKTFIPLSLVSPVIVVLAGFLGPEVRIWILIVALAIDVASALSAGRGEFRVAPSHFAERHGLFMIIVLGEVIVATGLAVVSEGPTGQSLGGAAVGVIGAIVLWWSYFSRIQEDMEHRLAATTSYERSRTARDLFTFLHYPIVAGVIGFAIAAEAVAVHPAQKLDAIPAVGLGGGIALVMLATAIIKWRAAHRISWERLAIGVTVAAFVAVCWQLPGVVLTGASIAITAVGLLIESLRGR